MARKVKPLWGYEHTHDGKDMERREARLDFGHIESLVGVTKNDAKVSLYRNIGTLLWAFYNQVFDPPSPSREERNAAMSEISDLLKELQFRLEGIDGVTRSRVEASLLRTYKKRRLKGRNSTLRALARHRPRQDEALVALDFFIEAVDAAELPTRPKPKGRKPNLVLQNFIFGLSNILSEHSGRDPLAGFYRNAVSDRYEGPLVELAEYILGQFAPDLEITNASIGEHIRRTIGDRSKS